VQKRHPDTMNKECRLRHSPLAAGCDSNIFCSAAVRSSRSVYTY